MMLKRSHIIIAAAILLIIVIALSIYSAMTFHVTSTDPGNGQTTNYIHAISIKFNQPLDPATAQRFSISPDTKGKVEVNGNTLRFIPTTGYDLKTTYTATIKSPRSTSGSTASDVKLTFNAKYVSPDQLSQEERDRLNAKTDGLRQVQPLTQALPYENENFKITYSVNEDQSLTIYVTPLAILNRPDQRPQYEADLRAHKQMALDYIKQHGGDLSKLNILVDPDPDDQGDAAGTSTH